MWSTDRDRSEPTQTGIRRKLAVAQHAPALRGNGAGAKACAAPASRQLELRHLVRQALALRMQGV